MAKKVIPQPGELAFEMFLARLLLQRVLVLQACCLVGSSSKGYRLATWSFAGLSLERWLFRGVVAWRGGCLAELSSREVAV